VAEAQQQPPERRDLEEVETFSKPGTADVTPGDTKKIAPLAKHYLAKPHPFTSCVRDQVKHGLSKDHANRRCAVLLDKFDPGRLKHSRKKLTEAEVADLILSDEEAARVLREVQARLVVIEGALGPLSEPRTTGKAGLVKAVPELIETPLSESVRIVQMGGPPAEPRAQAQAARALLTEATELRALAKELGGEVREAKDDPVADAERRMSKVKARSPRGRPTEAHSDGLTLKQGGSGELVGQAQARLKTLGYDVGVDGEYGEETKGAVESFQGDHELKPDGVLGDKTRIAMRGTSPEDVEKLRAGSPNGGNPDEEANPSEPEGDADADDTPTDTPTDTPSANVWLAKGRGVGQGEGDPSVKAAQEAMGAMGTYVGDAGPDGRFGPETEKGVKRIQRRYGLKADGAIGPETWALLKRHGKNGDKLEESIADVEEFRTKSITTPFGTTRWGMNYGKKPKGRDGQSAGGDFEKKHPRAAKGRTGGGQFIRSASGGLGSAIADKVGGGGQGFQQAVRQYQRENGLMVDGIVGHQTATALLSGGEAAQVTPGALTPQDKRKLRKRLLGNKPAADTSTPEPKLTDAERNKRRKKRNARNPQRDQSLAEADTKAEKEGKGDETTEQSVKCPECGTEQSARNADCKKCGHSLSKARDEKFKAKAAANKKEVEEGTLTAAARKKRPDSDFALPDRRYPIHDEAHARNALARVSQHGSADEKKKVRAAVKRRYPNIDVQEAACELLEASLRGAARKTSELAARIARIRRLPDGTFAPEGRGRVLRPGDSVSLGGSRGKVTPDGKSVMVAGHKLQLSPPSLQAAPSEEADAAVRSLAPQRRALERRKRVPSTGKAPELPKLDYDAALEKMRADSYQASPGLSDHDMLRQLAKKRSRIDTHMSDAEMDDVVSMIKMTDGNLAADVAKNGVNKENTRRVFGNLAKSLRNKTIIDPEDLDLIVKLRDAKPGGQRSPGEALSKDEIVGDLDYLWPGEEQSYGLTWVKAREDGLVDVHYADGSVGEGYDPPRAAEAVLDDQDYLARKQANDYARAKGAHNRRLASGGVSSMPPLGQRSPTMTLGGTPEHESIQRSIRQIRSRTSANAEMRDKQIAQLLSRVAEKRELTKGEKRQLKNAGGSVPVTTGPLGQASPGGKLSREERDAAARAAYPVGTNITTKVARIGGQEDLVQGEVVDHKFGQLRVKTDNHGTLVVPLDKVETSDQEVEPPPGFTDSMGGQHSPGQASPGTGKKKLGWTKGWEGDTSKARYVWGSMDKLINADSQSWADKYGTAAVDNDGNRFMIYGNSGYGGITTNGKAYRVGKDGKRESEAFMTASGGKPEIYARLGATAPDKSGKRFIPQGRTDQASYDYTDEPGMLAWAFTKEQLQSALDEDDGDAVMLKFDYEEMVPRPAVEAALAIQKTGQWSPGSSPGSGRLEVRKERGGKLDEYVWDRPGPEPGLTGGRVVAQRAGRGWYIYEGDPQTVGSTGSVRGRPMSDAQFAATYPDLRRFAGGQASPSSSLSREDALDAAEKLAVGDEVAVAPNAVIARDDEHSYVITDLEGTFVFGDAKTPDDVAELHDELANEAARDEAVDREIDDRKMGQRSPAMKVVDPKAAQSREKLQADLKAKHFPKADEVNVNEAQGVVEVWKDGRAQLYRLPGQQSPGYPGFLAGGAKAQAAANKADAARAKRQEAEGTGIWAKANPWPDPMKLPDAVDEGVGLGVHPLAKGTGVIFGKDGQASPKLWETEIAKVEAQGKDADGEFIDDLAGDVQSDWFPVVAEHDDYRAQEYVDLLQRLEDALDTVHGNPKGTSRGLYSDEDRFDNEIADAAADMLDPNYGQYSPGLAVGTQYEVTLLKNGAELDRFGETQLNSGAKLERTPDGINISSGGVTGRVQTFPVNAVMLADALDRSPPDVSAVLLPAWDEYANGSDKKASAKVLSELGGLKLGQASPGSVPDGFTPNTSSTELGEVPVGTKFIHDGYGYVVHKANGNWVIAKPIDPSTGEILTSDPAPSKYQGEKRRIFHYRMPPGAFGDMHPDYSDEWSVTPAAPLPVNPESPVRSAKGNIRNVKAMNDGKLKNLWADMSPYAHADPDGYAAVQTEMESRGFTTGAPAPVAAPVSASAPEPAPKPTPAPVAAQTAGNDDDLYDLLKKSVASVGAKSGDPAGDAPPASYIEPGAKADAADKALYDAPDLGMFSPEGNLAVDRMVKAIVNAEPGEREMMLKGTMDIISSDHPEVNDTAVRDEIATALKAEGVPLSDVGWIDLTLDKGGPTPSGEDPLAGLGDQPKPGTTPDFTPGEPEPGDDQKVSPAYSAKGNLRNIPKMSDAKLAGLADQMVGYEDKDPWAAQQVNNELEARGMDSVLADAKAAKIEAKAFADHGEPPAEEPTPTAAPNMSDRVATLNDAEPGHTETLPNGTQIVKTKSTYLVVKPTPGESYDSPEVYKDAKAAVDRADEWDAEPEVTEADQRLADAAQSLGPDWNAAAVQSALAQLATQGIDLDPAVENADTLVAVIKAAGLKP